MRWKCPVCNRSFAKVNQIHSCRSYDKAAYFRNKPVSVLEIYTEVENYFLSIGDVVADLVGNEMVFRASKIFVAVNIQQKGIKVKFYLNRSIDEFPILKSHIMSKNRVIHVVWLENEEDFDDQLKKWIFEAYILCR